MPTMGMLPLRTCGKLLKGNTLTLDRETAVHAHTFTLHTETMFVASVLAQAQAMAKGSRARAWAKHLLEGWRSVVSPAHFLNVGGSDWCVAFWRLVYSFDIVRKCAKCHRSGHHST